MNLCHFGCYSQNIVIRFRHTSSLNGLNGHVLLPWCGHPEERGPSGPVLLGYHNVFGLMSRLLIVGWRILWWYLPFEPVLPQHYWEEFQVAINGEAGVVKGSAKFLLCSVRNIGSSDHQLRVLLELVYSNFGYFVDCERETKVIHTNQLSLKGPCRHWNSGGQLDSVLNINSKLTDRVLVRASVTLDPITPGTYSCGLGHSKSRSRRILAPRDWQGCTSIC